MSSKPKQRKRSYNANSVVQIESYRKSKTKVKILPRNLEQESFLEKLESPVQIVTAHGIAGSGKTYMACGFAANELLDKKYKKIVFVRPNVATCGEAIGHLPGDMLEKMRPWIAPLLDSLIEQGYSKPELEGMIKDDIIEVVPISYIRGRSFKNSIIIADETQNLNKDAMLSLLTRIGENSKMIITGDTKQSDRSTNNGLSDLLVRCRDIKGFGFVELTRSERNKIINDIVLAYEQ